MAWAGCKAGTSLITTWWSLLTRMDPNCLVSAATCRVVGLASRSMRTGQGAPQILPTRRSMTCPDSACGSMVLAEARGHRQQLQGLLAAIRRGELPHETEYGALSTLTAIMGRMATYSGRVIHWEEAYHADVDLLPPTYTLDAQPPVLPDDQGIYPVAVPGVTPVV